MARCQNFQLLRNQSSTIAIRRALTAVRCVGRWSLDRWDRNSAFFFTRWFVRTSKSGRILIALLSKILKSGDTASLPVANGSGRWSEQSDWIWSELLQLSCVWSSAAQEIWWTPNESSFCPCCRSFPVYEKIKIKYLKQKILFTCGTPKNPPKQTRKILQTPLFHLETFLISSMCVSLLLKCPVFKW